MTQMVESYQANPEVSRQQMEAEQAARSGAPANGNGSGPAAGGPALNEVGVISALQAKAEKDADA